MKFIIMRVSGYMQNHQVCILQKQSLEKTGVDHNQISIARKMVTQEENLGQPRYQMNNDWQLLPAENLRNFSLGFL